MSTSESVLDQDLLLVTRMRDMVRGGLVEDVRVSAGLSQAEVAHAVGVTAAAVGHWEKGRSMPRGQAALRYARLLLDLERTVQR